MPKDERTVRKGDQFKIEPTAETPPWPMFIQVNRVARDGGWADIQMLSWAVLSRGRAPLPFPTEWTRTSWTMADVEASTPGDQAWDTYVAELTG